MSANESRVPALEGGFSHAELRRTLGSFATGVTVVTCRASDGTPQGLTVNSFNSVSLDPPLILWSLSVHSATRASFEECSHYAVNVLAADQVDISQRFSSHLADKFGGLATIDGAGGAPLLGGCCAWIECHNEVRHAGGDHVIFVGRVERIAQVPREPLIYFGGRYCRLRDG